MTELAIGDISAELDGAELREIAVAGWPTLDALYVTVRDAAWHTIPAEVIASRTRHVGEMTVTKLDVHHHNAEVDFRWRGIVEVHPDRLRFSMDGVAGKAFDANRIGFCMLHPQSLRGRPVRITGPAGEQQGMFPERISPHQLFVDVQSVAYPVADGWKVEIALEGDLFEIEDHRNWSDPGWKTYSTPLSAPRPVHHRIGQRTRQVVELRLRRSARASRRSRGRGPVRVQVGTWDVGVVPELGLGACELPRVGPAARAAVRGLSAAYLHVELEDGTPWQHYLDLSAAEAMDLDLPLDVALSAEPTRVLELAAALGRHGARIGRVSVFSPGEHTTVPGTVAAVRQTLEDVRISAPVGGGSRAHFAELNRATLQVDDWDFITYGLTPQVHHCDERSVLATIQAVPDGLSQARAIGAGKPVVVGPVTLRPRFRADAGSPDPMPAPAEDGPDVDERQHGPLAAAYLTGALTVLTGATALTTFQTVGARGVVDADGKLSPAARVIGVARELSGAPVRAVSVSHKGVAALAARTPTGLRLLVANLTEHQLELQIVGLRANRAALLEGALIDPERPALAPHAVALITTRGPV